MVSGVVVVLLCTTFAPIGAMKKLAGQVRLRTKRVSSKKGAQTRIHLDPPLESSAMALRSAPAVGAVSGLDATSGTAVPFSELASANSDLSTFGLIFDADHNAGHQLGSSTASTHFTVRW